MGLVLVACCPGGSSSNVFSMLAKGDVALSVTLTALSSMVTLFTLPVIMEFVTRTVSDLSGVEIELPVAKLLVQNAAQAITIASSPFIFNSGEMALPAICYALLMNVILLTYVYLIRRKQK